MDPILAQLSHTLPGAKSIEQIIRPLLEMLGAATGLESTYMTEIDLKRDVQHVRYARNTGAMQIPEGLSVPWSDTLCKRALDEGRMCTSDVPNCWGDSEAARALGIQTYVSAPVRGSEGELLGTLCAASASPRTVNAAALSILQLFSSLVATFIEREQLVADLQAANRQLRSYALSDPLTGLPNRRALMDELQRLLARGRRERCSVLIGLIDLDGFKAINDRYGHQQGDLFLQQVAQRLNGDLRGSDLVGRLGGDEFLLLCPGPILEADTELVGATIRSGAAFQAVQCLQERTFLATRGLYTLDTQAFDYPGASVGVVALQADQLDPDEAIRLADAQMYEIKRIRKQHARG
ncbi:sensor domain-containing diguanylate cyclase [Chitinimonas taiwanensis]|uniref:sensor domain-containing diguanylate cyclase n=1 Tax=Chitinimonas taiwanensis TaxID=240412 RepID=UPI0035AE0F20